MSERPRRQLISSGGPLEARAGYSRAVRVGTQVFVAGTTAYKDGQVHAPGDAAEQTRRIFEIIGGALGEAEASFADVVRFRVFVTDIAVAPEVLTVLGQVFGEVRPAGTLVAVTALVDPALLVEIEVDAILGSRG